MTLHNTLTGVAGSVTQAAASATSAVGGAAASATAPAATAAVATPTATVAVSTPSTTVAVDASTTPTGAAVQLAGDTGDSSAPVQVAAGTAVALPVADSPGTDSTAVSATTGAATGTTTGGLDVGTNATLDLSTTGTAGAAGSIDFTGSDGTLVVDASDVASTTAGGISGFAPGDTIDVRGIAGVTGASVANGALTLSAGGGTSLSLPLLGSFYPGALTVSSDGGGGVDVSFAGSSGSASAAVGTGTSGSGSGTSGTVATAAGTSAGSSGGTSVSTSPVGGTASGSSYLIALKGGLASGLSSFIMRTDAAGGSATDQTVTGPSVAVSGGTAVLDATGSAEQVARLYQAAFDRAPDQAGLQYWAGQVDAGAAAPVDVATCLADSAEFGALYGTQSNNAYIAQLYQDALGRTADAGGAQYWAGQLQDGAGRGDVMLGIASSQEGIQHALGTGGDVGEADAYRLYGCALGRAPDAAGLSFWTSALQAGASAQQVAQGFAESPEFAAKYSGASNNDFIDALYKNALGHAPDAAGAQYWSGVLNAGASRANVVLGVSDSTEARLADAGATHANWVFVKAG